MQSNKIYKIYKILHHTYGPQGWWPVSGKGKENGVKDDAGHLLNYHPNNYSYPNTESQKFEICAGAILTQNTGWIGAEKALLNLKKINALNPSVILKMDEWELKSAIRPAGYYNQKSSKLRKFSSFFLSLNKRTPSREELLSVWGIGKETADSMLLYAFKKPTFVVDAYTKRIFANLGFMDETSSYDEIKDLFEKNLKPDLAVYQEYHALIVEHAKRHYSKKPYGINCFLKNYKLHG